MIGDPEDPAFEQRGVEFPASWSQNATNIVAQKYFRGRLGSPERESSVKQMISRVAGHDRRLGARRRLLRRRRGRRRLRGRADPHPPAPEGRLQQPGLVQRRLRGAAAVHRLLHPLASRTRWSRSSTGTPRRGSSSAAARARGSTSRTSAARSSSSPRAGSPPGPVSFMRGADAWAGDDQVRRQDAPGGEDGRARRRPPRHRGLHLVQGARGEEGRRAARRRLRHVDRRRRASPRSSTRTPTTRSASATSSWRRSRPTPTGT